MNTQSVLFCLRFDILNMNYTVPSEAFQVMKGNKPNRNWPRFGRISFKKVELKYREETPLALKGVSFDIDSQEKIGVIGRTGSGKSSLGAALFRLVELKRGTIMIDGINIASVGLQDLRSRISIIPQDPLLFIGTIRHNLDPFGKHSDAEIWAVLEKTRLKETIVSLEFKLSSPVIENGANFSVGERQLLCMARALLRNNKILFLDEATAGIDTETDLKIQDTLREEFKNCTMITVAHRLNTIMNCSRVMVMDNGSVVEFDSPEKLLQDSSSRFAKYHESPITKVWKFKIPYIQVNQIFSFKCLISLKFKSSVPITLECLKLSASENIAH
ncbi:Multidrug resistance-associated protein 5 [Armadillidium nasatum]|uniref:Multidrug resistance-associated protein 5 n=1 Tax=Armadillidium nasatum TaxID=96803 RepID=A0A5N5TC75_9CRUS|nr:Multidrug resistance-associated protein 5 [Armadillidium nasatum]